MGHFKNTKINIKFSQPLIFHLLFNGGHHDYAIVPPFQIPNSYLLITVNAHSSIRSSTTSLLTSISKFQSCINSLSSPIVTTPHKSPLLSIIFSSSLSTSGRWPIRRSQQPSLEHPPTFHWPSLNFLHLSWLFHKTFVINNLNAWVHNLQVKK